MSIFVETGDDEFEADNDGHDDRVMALCLACYAIRQSPKLLAELDTKSKNHVPEAVDLMLNDSPPPRHAHPGIPEQLREQLKENNHAIVGNPIRSELELVF